MVRLERVQEQLDAKGLSANAASQLAGLGRDYVRDLLRGKVRDPSTSRLRRLAAALDTSVEYLTGIEEVPGTGLLASAPKLSKLTLPITYRVRGGFFEDDDGAIHFEIDWPVPILDRAESFQWLEWVEDPSESYPVARDALLHATRLVGTLESGDLVVIERQAPPNLHQRTLRRVERLPGDQFRLVPAIPGQNGSWSLGQLFKGAGDFRIQARVIAIYQYMDAPVGDMMRAAGKAND